MKNTLFRKLREPESGAGGAPAVAAAPAAGTPAPSDAGGAGSPAPSDPAPSASAWPNPDTDFAAWEDRWSNASDEERDAYERGLAPKADETDPVDPPGDGSEAPEEVGEPAAPVEIAEDAEITEAVLATLPANVRKALQDAQELGERFESLHPLINAEADLRDFLDDPITKRRLAERQHGIGMPKWLEGDVNIDAIVDRYLDNAGKEIDAALDRDGAKASLSELVKNVVIDVTRRVELKGEFETRRVQEQARRERVLSEGLSALTQEFAALKSDKHIDSPEHPINSFRNELLTALENGDVSFEYAVRNMKAMFAGHSVGSVGQAVQAAQAKVRTSFLGNITKAARQSAVTATGVARNAPPPAANAHGVDEGRFLSDPAYQAAINERADSMAEGGNYALLDFLGQLHDRNRTRR